MFGLLTVRKIKIGNKEYVATHRNPKTGDIWIEDLCDKSLFEGVGSIQANITSTYKN